MSNVQYKDADNTGTAFTNPKKLTAKHPDYTGKVKVGGQYYWVSMWRKKDKNENLFFSLSFTERQAPPSYQNLRLAWIHRRVRQLPHRNRISLTKTCPSKE